MTNNANISTTDWIHNSTFIADINKEKSGIHVPLEVYEGCK